MKVRAVLGYGGAGLTVLLAALTPFWFSGFISRGVAALPLHVDEVYSGGPVLRTVSMNGYDVRIHRAVYPHMLQRERAFVQIDWAPAKALPAHVSNLIDIDADGKPDVRVTFDVPRDAKVPLRVNAESLNAEYSALQDIGKDRFSALIARVDEAVVVRVPLANGR